MEFIYMTRWRLRGENVNCFYIYLCVYLVICHFATHNKQYYLETNKNQLGKEKKLIHFTVYPSYSMIIGPKYKTKICVKCGFVIFKVS